MRRASLSSVERLRWSVEIPSASNFIHSATWRNSVSSVVKLIVLMSLGVTALSRPQRDHPSGVFHPKGHFVLNGLLLKVSRVRRNRIQ